MLDTAVHAPAGTVTEDGFSFGILSIARDWAWVSQKLRCHLVEDSSGIIAFDSRGAPCAAIVFDSFTATAACCHVVVENPLVLRRGFLQAAAEAAFIHAKRHVLIGITPSDNLKALRFNQRIGWQEIYRVRDGYAFGIDLVVQEMRRESCPWLAPGFRHDA